MFGLFRGAVKSATLGAVVVLGLGGYGYAKLAGSKLPETPGTIVTLGACRTTASLTGGTLPVTFEAFLKREKEQNFLAGAGSAGLVAERREWSHGGMAWVLDQGFADRQAEAVKERRRIAARDVAALVKGLRSADAIEREISARELLLRTGETKGYAYDLPEAPRGEAAKAWETWWADPANQRKYAAKRTLDVIDDALDALRRATGGAPSSGGTSGK